MRDVKEILLYAGWRSGRAMLYSTWPHRLPRYIYLRILMHKVSNQTMYKICIALRRRRLGLSLLLNKKLFTAGGQGLTS